MKKPIVSVRIDKDLAAKLDKIARRNRRSREQQVVWMLEKAIEALESGKDGAE